MFKYLPIAYEHPRDEEARSMMHNAACIAAMAFSNASVGVNHALAHAFGARFGVAHGRANALMLPHVHCLQRGGADQVHAVAEPAGVHGAQEVRHDGGPAGLGGDTVEEKVKNLVAATEQLLDRLEIPRSIAELGIPEGGVREGDARVGEDRVRRSFVALEPAHAAGERNGRVVLEGVRGAAGVAPGHRSGRGEGMVVRMTTNAVWIQDGPGAGAGSLRDEAAEKAERRRTARWCWISPAWKRIDGNGVRALEELAGLADEKSVKVVLRGVNMRHLPSAQAAEIGAALHRPDVKPAFPQSVDLTPKISALPTRGGISSSYRATKPFVP